VDAILAGLIDGAALAAHMVDSEAGDVETEAQPDARAIRLDGRRRMARVRWFDESLAKIKEDKETGET